MLTIKYFSGNAENSEIKSVHALAASPHLMIEGDGSRAVQVLPDENFPHGAVQVGDLNAVGSRVRPVDLPADSIHRQAISRHQAYTERDVERWSNDSVESNSIIHVSHPPHL